MLNISRVLACLLSRVTENFIILEIGIYGRYTLMLGQNIPRLCTLGIPYKWQRLSEYCWVSHGCIIPETPPSHMRVRATVSQCSGQRRGCSTPGFLLLNDALRGLFALKMKSSSSSCEEYQLKDIIKVH